jgi:hypothetical protein
MTVANVVMVNAEREKGVAEAMVVGETDHGNLTVVAMACEVMMGW